jgi:hypothetical protein
VKLLLKIDVSFFSTATDSGHFVVQAVPFLEALCGRLRLRGPPGSFMGSLWGAWVAPSSSLKAAFCVLVCSWTSFGVPLGSSGGPGGSERVFRHLLVDV